MKTIAKIFLNGQSQTVRLPKAFRFKGKKVILKPLGNSSWPKGFWDVFTPDTDFKTPEPLPTKDFNLD